MLKKIYVRFLLWVLGPAISEMKIRAAQTYVSPIVFPNGTTGSEWVLLMRKVGQSDSICSAMVSNAGIKSFQPAV